MTKSKVRIQAAASFRIDEIYRYTLNKHGAAQAKKYIRELFNSFEKISDKKVFSRPIPADFGVQGFYYRYEHHFIYWKYLDNGEVGIATILHERMHQIEHFKLRGVVQGKQSYLPFYLLLNFKLFLPEQFYF